MNIANLTSRNVSVYANDDKGEKIIMWSKFEEEARTSSAKQEHVGTLDNDIQLFTPQRPISITIKPSDPAVDGIIVSLMAAEYLKTQDADEFKLVTTLDGERDVRVFTVDASPESCVYKHPTPVDFKSVMTGTDNRPIGVRRLNEYEPLTVEVIRAARAKRAKTQ